MRELGQKYQWYRFSKIKARQWDVPIHIRTDKFGQIAFYRMKLHAKVLLNENYYEKHGSVLLVDYVQKELEKKERIVVETEHWVAVVPYWAVWPFETLLLPKVHDQLNRINRGSS